MTYTPAEDRYSKMVYRRCGKTGGQKDRFRYHRHVTPLI